MPPEEQDPEDFWKIVEPDEELEAKDPNFVGPLSYKKVKRHQYLIHPRDRLKRKKFDWWEADISFIPICMGQIKRS